jgi:hypothetical protein
MLFALVTMLSALLLIGTLALWRRSYHTPDVIDVNPGRHHSDRHSSIRIRFVSINGGIGVELSRWHPRLENDNTFYTFPGEPPAVIFRRPAVHGTAPPDPFLAEADRLFAQGILVYPVPWPDEKPRQWYAGDSVDDSFSVSQGQTHRRGGFGLGRFEDEADAVYSAHAVWWPTWFAVVLFAIAPALRLVTIVRRRARRQSDACPICGYDLRATPDRCSECGSETRRSALRA